MCYSNCPWENYWGDCAMTTKQGMPGSHCYDPPEKEESDEKEDLAENDTND